MSHPVPSVETESFFDALGSASFLTLTTIPVSVPLCVQTEMFFDALGSASVLTLTTGSLLLSGPITPRKV